MAVAHTQECHNSFDSDWHHKSKVDCGDMSLPYMHTLGTMANRESHDVWVVVGCCSQYQGKVSNSEHVSDKRISQPVIVMYNTYPTTKPSDLQ